LGFGRSYQDATFKVYRPSSDTCNCGIFGPATSTGLLGEISFETPILSHPSLDLVARLGLDDRSAVLLSGDTTAESRGPDGTFITTVMRHEFHAILPGVRLSAGPALALIPGLRLVAAPTATIFPFRSQGQLQRIISPAENLFLETGESTRPVDGHTPVDFRAVMFGADLSLLGRIPLGVRLALRPELRAMFTFGSLADDVPWHQDAFAGLIGFSYLLTPPPVPAPAPDTPAVMAVAPTPAPKPFLGATIVARGVDDKGRLYDDPVIEIQRTPWTEGVPVVPYIFFDSASARLPERYVKLATPESRERFSLDSLPAINPVDIHWQILNVVGRRMQENPKVTLTITGTASGDEATEEGGTRLGMARAEAVANYLASVWRIAPSRVATAFVPRSASSSSEDSQEGRQENRRAELRFSDDIILRPVVIHRLATIASPPAVRFMREIVADTTVAEWYVTVVQGGKELLRFDGSGGQGTLEQQKQWSLADMRVNHDMTPIRYRLYVRDVIGQEVIAEGAFKVAERTTIRPRDSSDREVVQYSIVGFPYNSADLLPRHLQQLDELARTITEQSDVQIAGYTDRIGDPDRNRQLSLGRAKAVQEAIRAARARLGLTPVPAMTVLGLGSEREVFNNLLPEGRFLSRMVQITVIKHGSR
jgi:outer membrane protein OmpA-like peptidoglycan-associated protein